MSALPQPSVEAASRLVIQLPAGDHRLDEIQALRYRVYIDEQKKPLAAADHLRRRLGDRLDLSATHFMALEHGAVIGAGRINVLPIAHPLAERAGLGVLGDMGLEQLAYISKVVLAPECRTGTTLAARLLVAMAHWGVDQGLEFGFCHCHPGLVGMYERLGLLRMQRPWMDPELGSQVLMSIFADKMGALSRFSRRNRAHALSDTVRARCVAARLQLGQAGDGNGECRVQPSEPDGGHPRTHAGACRAGGASCQTPARPPQPGQAILSG